MLIQQHWLTTCRRVVSPNVNDRPDCDDISLIVVHGISLPPGQYGGPYIDQLFCNALSPTEHPYFQEVSQLRVSSHLLIRRDGECVQYAPFDKRAWHAGKSTFQGRDNCNDFSIGIELEGEDNTPYDKSQYQRLAQVCLLLMSYYPLIRDSAGAQSEPHTIDGYTRIVGHSEVAPGRKTDPGPSFDWGLLRRLMAEIKSKT